MENKPTGNKLYTGAGDKGLTSLLPGSQVSKADERIDAIGGTEEIISALGAVRAATSCPIFTGKLLRVQKTLRTLAAGLADPRSGKYVFSAEEISFLESDMDEMISHLHDANRMDDLPGGCEQSARLDVARSVTRRAERALIAMDRRYAVPASFKQYINRLGDWLLAAARYADLLDRKQKEKAAAAQTQEATAQPVVTGGTAGASAMQPTPTVSAPAPAPVVVNIHTTPTPAPTDPTVEAVLHEVMARMGGGKVLDLARATRLIEAIEARAAAEGKKAVIAVVNAEGNPIAVHVMDGAFLVSYDVAVRKAYTAVAVKMPTLELSKLVQPGQTFYGLQNLDRIVTFGGGIPLTVGGTIVGGLGVSGGTGEEDHALASYGVSVFPNI